MGILHEKVQLFKNFCLYLLVTNLNRKKIGLFLCDWLCSFNNAAVEWTCIPNYTTLSGSCKIIQQACLQTLARAVSLLSFCCKPQILPVCVRLEFSFLGRRDPGFATSIWNSSSIKLLVGIVDKWLSISASTVVMNRLHGVLTLQEGLSSLCPQWAPFFTVLKHLSAAFSPHSLGMGEDVCVCVFPCPKRSLPRDYPSFCREPLELLTQQLPAEKLCICIDCACLYLCVFLRVSLLFPPQ